MTQVVSDNGLPKPSRKGRIPLTLPGKPRNQEANRKRLVQALQYIESRGVQAAQIRANLESIDVETIANNLKPTRRILSDIANFEDDYVTRRLGELLGVDVRTWDPRMALLDRIHGWETKTQEPQSLIASTSAGERQSDEGLRRTSTAANEPAVESPSANASAGFTADAALAEAKHIIAAASDAELEEIDWFHNPKTERERAIRAAIIRRIEAEKSNGFLSGPVWIVTELWELVGGMKPWKRVTMGADLCSAISKWKKRVREECLTEQKANQRRLIDLARQELDGRAAN